MQSRPKGSPLGIWMGKHGPLKNEYLKVSTCIVLTRRWKTVPFTDKRLTLSLSVSVCLSVCLFSSSSSSSSSSSLFFSTCIASAGLSPSNRTERKKSKTKNKQTKTYPFSIFRSSGISPQHLILLVPSGTRKRMSVIEAWHIAVTVTWLWLWHQLLQHDILQ